MSTVENSDPRLQGAHQAATRGDFEMAEQLLRMVLSDDANCLQALDLMGFVQYFQGRPEVAEASCRRALALDPARPYSNKGLGLCLAKQGKLDEGLPYLFEAVRLAPEWFDPRWDMAIVLLEAGRFEQALEAIASAELAIPAEKQRFTQLRAEVLRRSAASAGAETPAKASTNRES